MTQDRINTLALRLAAELCVAGIFGVILWRQDAPAWAFTLLILIGTRASKLELHSGLGYLQQTLQRRRIDVETAVAPTADQAALIEAMEGAERTKGIGGVQPTPLKRHGVGRWGR